MVVFGLLTYSNRQRQLIPLLARDTCALLHYTYLIILNITRYRACKNVTSGVVLNWSWLAGQRIVKAHGQFGQDVVDDNDSFKLHCPFIVCPGVAAIWN